MFPRIYFLILKHQFYIVQINRMDLDLKVKKEGKKRLAIFVISVLIIAIILMNIVNYIVS